MLTAAVIFTVLTLGISGLVLAAGYARYRRSILSESIEA